MYKLYLTDTNYNIIAPLDSNNMGLNNITFNFNLNESRELIVKCNTNLDEVYDFLLLPEACLLLEIGPYKIGFSKRNNTITHLLPYGNIGSGSDFSSAIRLDKYTDYQSDYPVTTESLSDATGRSANYIINTYQNQAKEFYRIKPFNMSDNADASSLNEKSSQLRLYNEAVNYLIETQPNDSIDGQIKRQNGSLELRFYSSSYDLNNNKRTIILNQDYDSSCQALVDQIDPSKFTIKVLKDINVTLNTGMYSNYELLNEICKNRSLSWREIGIVNGKTEIEIGDFDSLSPTHYASNQTIDDIFDDNIRIVSATQYYPSIKVELDIKQFIPEGDNIMVEYREYQENIDGTKREIFNINKIQNHKGGSIELYNLNQL